MRRIVEWAAAETVPPRAAVCRLQGLPETGSLPPRLAALLDAAVAEYRRLAEPRAIVADISPAAFGALYRGEGRDARETPLERIYPQAGRLALFACTVGAGLTARIGDLFARHEPALGAALDSVSSAAADYVAELTGARYLAEVDEGGRRGWRVLPYSPGYCGWEVTGQRALFASLRPEAIGITLNTSCLMDPLKSVSGVLVAGRARIHVFRPVFECCAGCRDQACRERMARVLGREGRRTPRLPTARRRVARAEEEG